MWVTGDACTNMSSDGPSSASTFSATVTSSSSARRPSPPGLPSHPSASSPGSASTFAKISAASSGKATHPAAASPDSAKPYGSAVAVVTSSVRGLHASSSVLSFFWLSGFQLVWFRLYWLNSLRLSKHRFPPVFALILQKKTPSMIRGTFTRNLQTACKLQ